MFFTTVSSIIGVLGAIERFQIIAIAIEAFYVAANISSIYYVFYPETEYARSPACSIILCIYAVISFLILVGLTLITALLGYLLDTGEKTAKDEGLPDEPAFIFVIAGVVLIVVNSLPVIQCILLYCIRRKRLEIADQMNEELVGPQGYAPVPNSASGTEYVPPKVPETESNQQV